MKLIIALSLFFTLLFFSGFARASNFQCRAALNQVCACHSVVTYERSYTNPHTVWVTTPVWSQCIRCSQRM